MAARADDLSAERVLRPADRIDDGGDFFRVAVVADGSEQIGGLQELVFRNAGDALHHLGRVARILTLQELVDAAGVFERGVESDVGGSAGGGLSERSPAGFVVPRSDRS